MRRFSLVTIVLLIALLCCSVLLAQDGPSGEKARANARTTTTSGPFDPKDFSGIWLLQRATQTIGPNPPALTPAGAAAMKGRIPESSVSVPAFSNDPIRQCNPNGFPRIIFDAEPIEFTYTFNKDRVLQFFQWDRVLREIWTDGREVPSGQNLEDLGPAWYGHSVGKWEGDTFVVNTVGLNESAWLDEEKGRPKSFHARIEERYKRVDADTFTVQFTLYDPEYYAATWVGDVKTFKRMPPDTYTYFGWKGLFGGITDAICAPENEVENYNKRFRDPGTVGLNPEKRQ
jgi:hypothetical protein